MKAMPDGRTRLALGAATGALWTLLLVGLSGWEAELPVILGGSLGFAALLAGLGRRFKALNIVWTAGTVVLMPGFYYAAILAGFSVGEAVLDSLVTLGAVGGLVGAGLVWAWTAIASPAVARRGVLARTLLGGMLAGGIGLPVMGLAQGALTLVGLHALWQGVVLWALFSGEGEGEGEG